MKKTVIVLGQARSGTSMTAGLLNILGVNLHHVDNPSSQNPKGAFEDRGFNSITSKMHIDLKKGYTKEKMKELWDDEIKKLLERKSEDDIWGWKSALTHYNIDLFLPHLNNPHFIVVTRNKADAAKSLVVHRKDVYNAVISFEEAIKDVTRSMKVLEEVVDDLKKRQYPVLNTTYGSIKTSPVPELKKMAEFLEIPLTDEMKQQVKEFIMPKYSTIKKG